MDVIQEAFTLTKGDSDVTSADGATSATTYTDIWLYHVPVGLGLIILPGHTFSVYLEDTNDAEMGATVLLKVSVLDSSKQDRKTILGPVQYITLKEFVDRDKMARFNINAPVKLYERQYLAIEATGNGSYGVDQTGSSSDSYFEMAIQRVRQPLG